MAISVTEAVATYSIGGFYYDFLGTVLAFTALACFFRIFQVCGYAVAGEAWQDNNTTINYDDVEYNIATAVSIVRKIAPYTQ